MGYQFNPFSGNFDIAGVVGATGPNGLDGKTVLSGSGAPSGGTGEDGDFYIDLDVYDIYGPKSAGTWGSGTSLIGPSGGAEELDDLSDVAITSPVQGETLVYDSIAGAFVNDTIAGGGGADELDDLSDVAIDGDTLAEGQVLVYDGTEWVNDTIAGGGGNSTGGDLFLYATCF